MAGSEPPLAVPAFLDEAEWQANEQLPLLGLDRVYDYFLESATTMIGVSDTASRWLEIETRIRDTAGLLSTQLRASSRLAFSILYRAGGEKSEHLGRCSTSVFRVAAMACNRRKRSTRS